MNEHDIDRMMQCITCDSDPQKCRCTEADEDVYGMCTKWTKKRKEE